MKRLLVFSTVFLFSGWLVAQTTQDAGQLLYHHRYDSACVLLHDLISKDPNNVRPWWLLAQAYLEKDKLKPLKDTLLKAPAAVSGTPLLRAVSGHILLREKDSAAAAAY